MANTPFDSIESAHQYVSMLVAQVEEVTSDVEKDIQAAARSRASRHLDALQIVDYKLRHLAQHLSASRRILNDLRILRRVLVAKEDAEASPPETSGMDFAQPCHLPQTGIRR